MGAFLVIKNTGTMEFISIVPSESRLWEQVWRLYLDSFPEHERRRISSHSRACEDKAFKTHIALENGNLLGLLFYWEYEGYIYIEHIAVNPSMRDNGIGATMMGELLADNFDRKVILEIDPPADENSQRRLEFYKRLGFADTGTVYLHPSYTKNGTPHELLVLSWPEAASESEMARFKEFMRDHPLKYID